MVSSMRIAVRRSWLALALAAALGITMPMAAAMAGVAAATPSVGPVAVVAAAVRAGAAKPSSAPATERTQVLAAEGTRTRRVTSPWARPSLLVDMPAGGLAAHRSPRASSPVVGTVVAASKYYRVPLVLWVEDTAKDGSWGRVQLPYVWPRTSGWIRLAGLPRARTAYHVDVDLSEHRVRVYRGDDLRFAAPGATGASSSPTPPGRYVVTDRVPFSPGSSLGSFAFGISGIQPHLPAGWSGGNQLAIHGTNSPSTIGTSASAGCVRVSETTLARLKPFLMLGTPVVIHA